MRPPLAKLLLLVGHKGVNPTTVTNNLYLRAYHAQISFFEFACLNFCTKHARWTADCLLFIWSRKALLYKGIKQQFNSVNTRRTQCVNFV